MPNWFNETNIIWVIIAASVVFWLLVAGGLGYVAMHFILKFL